MKRATILTSDADFVGRSGFIVEIDAKHGWVSIDNGDKRIFLQGYEGSQFIAEVDATHEQVQTLSRATVVLAHARPYIES